MRPQPNRQQMARAQQNMQIQQMAIQQQMAVNQQMAIQQNMAVQQNLAQQSMNMGMPQQQMRMVPQTMNMGMNMAAQGMNTGMAMAQQGMNAGMGMGMGMAQGMNQYQQYQVNYSQYNYFVPPMQMMVAPDNQLMQRFAQLDIDHSGTISIQEIMVGYQQFRFPYMSAKLLLQAISNLPYIDQTNFPLFDQYIRSMWQAFCQSGNNSPTIMAQQVQQALQLLNFQSQPQVIMALINKYDLEKQGIEFGEFMSICSYLLICQKLMNQFDTQKKRTLNVDMNGLESLCLWFM
ncbi:Programmed_cell death protein-like protein [Hexamita inflata]|uniref:Programmed cell death protein-like protein n=1 Tax=Hexamita inflata TaxID=28002 RepID=A0AA86U403_9EUKA|nr:Programmed cell death protein-like protein [Hexamita inflata]